MPREPTTPRRTEPSRASASVHCSMSFFQVIPYPSRIASQVDNRPNHCNIVLNGVEDAVWKRPAEQPVIVAVDDAVNSRSDLEPFDITPEARQKIIAQSGFLCFVKQETFIQILKGILR